MTVVDQVRQSLAARKLRDDIFGKDYFWDRAWDILLRLFLAKLEDRKVTATNLYIASEISPEVGARWIVALRDGGYLRTYPDIPDRQGIYVELTVAGSQHMEKFFERVAGLSF